MYNWNRKNTDGSINCDYQFVELSQSYGEFVSCCRNLTDNISFNLNLYKISLNLKIIIVICFCHALLKGIFFCPTFKRTPFRPVYQLDVQPTGYVFLTNKKKSIGSDGQGYFDLI